MSRSRRAVLVGAVLFLLSMIMARPAAAIPPGGLQCLNSMGGSLSVTPSTITAGQFVTVAWDVGTPDPRTCPGLFSQQLDGEFVAAHGSRVLQPTASHTFHLKGFHGGFNRELATASVTVPEPLAQLPGLYRGTINSDFGSTTGLTAEVRGQPSALTATVTLDPGVGADCHGAQHLDATTFDLAGYRASVGLDGSSTYSFSGQFAFDTSVLGASVHVVVHVTINGATLTADGQAFAGTADVLIKPSIFDDCRKSWPFTTIRVPDVTVPSVLEMTVAQARSTLAAASLRISVSSAIDRFCGTPRGRIMHQTPDAETLVQPGSVVKVVTALRPPACP
jgi:hypothetical protein